MFVKNFLFFFSFFTLTKFCFAQVPVREEPRHHIVLQNRYIRLLDVRIPTGDTTLFHVHEIPSLFVILSATKTESQIKGENWVEGISVPGTTWYNGFTSGPLIHRVHNNDTALFHVMDIEILSNYSKGYLPPLPIDTLFTNEKAFAYHLALSNKESKKQMEGRGPILIVVVSGPGITVHFSNNKTQDIYQGGFVWVDPQTKCSLQNKDVGETSIVMFELK